MATAADPCRGGHPCNGAAGLRGPGEEGAAREIWRAEADCREDRFKPETQEAGCEGGSDRSTGCSASPVRRTLGALLAGRTRCRGHPGRRADLDVAKGR